MVFVYFRQKIYKLETLVQSSSHDFGKLVQHVNPIVQLIIKLLVLMLVFCPQSKLLFAHITSQLASYLRAM